MRLEPIRERFTLQVSSPTAALQTVADYAGRARILEHSPSRVVFRLGSAFVFRMLGTFYEPGRRSIPVKVTVALSDDRPRLDLEMDSQERGYVFRAPWMAEAYDDRFRQIFTELQRVTEDRSR